MSEELQPEELPDDTNDTKNKGFVKPSEPEFANLWVESAFTPVSDDIMATIMEGEKRQSDTLTKVYRKIKEIEEKDLEEGVLGPALSREMRVRRLSRSMSKKLEKSMLWTLRIFEKAKRKMNGYGIG